MATDYWPDEEGYIWEGCMVVPCYAAGSIAEMASVLLNGTTAGRIEVDHGAAAGDSIGIALRAASTGDYVPVAFNGIVKMTAACTITLGDLLVGNGGNNAQVVQYADTDCEDWNGGTAHILGRALQAAGTTGDEILMLLHGGQA